jgi:hypothetical protein
MKKLLFALLVILSCASAYAITPPISCWTFDDDEIATTTVVDRMNLQNGTLWGTVYPGQSCLHEQCVYHDGQADSGIIIQSNPAYDFGGVTNHTYCVYFKNNDSIQDTFRSLFYRGFSDGADTWEKVYFNWNIDPLGYLYEHRYNGGAADLPLNAYGVTDETSNWHLLCAGTNYTATTDALFGYVDGIYYLDNTETQNGMAAGLPLLIGTANGTNTIQSFVGWIDDFMVFDYALSQADIDFLNSTTGQCGAAVIPNCTPDWDCSGYAACNKSDLAACNAVTDDNNCSIAYGGDYSEFSPQPCNYCSRNINTLSQAGCVGGISTVCYNDSNFYTCCNVTSIPGDCYNNQIQTGPTVCVNSSCGGYYSADDITAASFDLMGSFVIAIIVFIPLIVLVLLGIWGYHAMKKVRR